MIEKEYKCPDCGTLMENRLGLFWDSSVTKCYFKYGCPNCGSEFTHRLSKEEEAEVKRTAEARNAEARKHLEEAKIKGRVKRFVNYWARPVTGAIGGSILGAAIGGPAGALFGGVLGALLGAAAKEEERQRRRSND